MPVVKISREELKRSIKLQPAWYPALIKECKAEPTKDKSGINYNFYLSIEDGSDSGKDFKHSVNEAVKGSFIKQIVEAALSTESEVYKIDVESDFEFDTDSVAGKWVKVKIVNEQFQGDLVNKIKGWLPYHYDTESIPF